MQLHDVYSEAGKALKRVRIDLNLTPEAVSQALDDIAAEVESVEDVRRAAAEPLSSLTADQEEEVDAEFAALLAEASRPPTATGVGVGAGVGAGAGAGAGAGVLPAPAPAPYVPVFPPVPQHVPATAGEGSGQPVAAREAALA
jgi:hypothetical protein